MPIIQPKGFDTSAFEMEGVVFTHAEGGQALRVLIVPVVRGLLGSELQLLRILSYSPLPLDVSILPPMQTEGSAQAEDEARYSPKSATKRPPDLEIFTRQFFEVEREKFDALIFTGTPNESLPFTQHEFWQELVSLMNFAATNARSTLFLGWTAQAGLYYNYRIGKGILKDRLFGVYQHRVLIESDPILRGIDGQLYLPHARSTGLDEHSVLASPDLEVLVFGTRSKSSVIRSVNGQMVFFTGSGEFDEDSLHKEYLRTLKKNSRAKKPSGYYCHGKPRSRWKSTASLLFLNWLTAIHTGHLFV